MECHPKTLLANSWRPCELVAARSRSMCKWHHLYVWQYYSFHLVYLFYAIYVSRRTYTMQQTIDGILRLGPSACHCRCCCCCYCRRCHLNCCCCSWNCSANFSNDSSCNPTATADWDQELDVAVIEPYHHLMCDLINAVIAVAHKMMAGCSVGFVEWTSTRSMFANHFVWFDSNGFWNASVQWCCWPQSSSTEDPNENRSVVHSMNYTGD